MPPSLAGKDAYLHAETGTGKTLAYLLPIFCRLDAKQEATQVVIVAPTHESFLDPMVVGAYLPRDLLRAKFAVFRQIPSRLPHHPHRHPRQRFASARAQKKFLTIQRN